MFKRIISFCLWGNNKDYLLGALANAKLVNKVYPGWNAVFYVESETYKNNLGLIDDILKFPNVTVLESEFPQNSDGMFQRFTPLLYPQCDIFVSRDCDSRLNDKEYQAVLRWEQLSNAQFHSMRDHIFHRNPPILGGMCGFKNTGIINPRWIYNMMSYHKNGNYGDDQNALAHLYRLFPSYFLINSFEASNSECAFPPHKPIEVGSFIGQRITFEDKPGKL